MIFEIHGAGFTNKGAQLMLYTVLDRLKAMVPEARFAYDPGHRGCTFKDRARLGFLNIFRLSPKMRSWRIMPAVSGMVGASVPRSWRERYGIVLQTEVDALIDISGYAHGDKFGTYFTHSLNIKASSYARRGKPVILLPQMFGPFERKETGHAFAKTVSLSTAIYARERKSMEWVEKIAPNAEAVRMAPDITLSVGKPPASLAFRDRCEVLLIPNSKMLTHAGPEWANRYEEIMLALAERAKISGAEVVVLLHDLSARDRTLGAALAEKMLPGPTRVEVIEDPLMLKERISRARLIISSRFHSVAGALSTGVPAIVLGWAHKYPELLGDYGVPEFEVRPEEPLEVMYEQIDRLADAAQWEQTHKRLRERGAELARASDAMWEEVREILGLSK